jgi:hypothetical protein
MNGLEEMTEIFRELSLENQFRLLECSQISQIAENSVQKAFSGRYLYGAVNDGDRERVIHRRRDVWGES